MELANLENMSDEELIAYQQRAFEEDDKWRRDIAKAIQSLAELHKRNVNRLEDHLARIKKLEEKNG